MNKMLGYLKDYKRESVLAPLFKMLEATFDLFVPLVMADIVNIGIAAHDLYSCAVRHFAAAGHDRPCLQPDGTVFFRKGGRGLFHSSAPRPV